MREYDIGWMRPADLPEVLGIERATRGERAWTEQQFRDAQGDRSTITYSATHNKRVVGYAVVECVGKQMRLLNFNTHPAMRSRGVAAVMSDWLKIKMVQMGRLVIVADVIETDLTTQQFYASQGFVATEVLRGAFEDLDAYRFIFRAEWAEEERPLPAEAACEV